MNYDDIDYAKMKAPAGCVWVCAACGKTSDHKLKSKAEHCMDGWDISCAVNSVLARECDLTRNENGFVTHIEVEYEGQDIGSEVGKSE